MPSADVGRGAGPSHGGPLPWTRVTRLAAPHPTPPETSSHNDFFKRVTGPPRRLCPPPPPRDDTPSEAVIRPSPVTWAPARRGPRGPPRAPVPPTWIISTRSARATRHGAARRRGNRGEADGIGHTGHTDGERPRSRRRPRRRARPQRRDEYVLPLESSRNGVRPRPTPAFDAPSSRVDVRIVLGRVPRPMSMDFSASEVRRPGGVRDGHLSSEGCGRGRTQVRWRAHAVDAHDRSDRVQRFSPSNGRPCAS